MSASEDNTSHLLPAFPVTHPSSHHLPTWNPFNNTNPHTKTWCPSSTTKCHNSPSCAPCNRRHLIILATGRSGSTTLLRMLNLLPNVRLSGENANTLFFASTITSNLRNNRGTGNKNNTILRQDFDRTEGAWMHNAIPKQTMACVMQHVLYALNPPPLEVQRLRRSVEEFDRHTILGMKTIRFHKGDWTPKAAAQFLRTNFPCSRIVVNVRSDTQSQLSSITGTFTGNITNSRRNMNETFIKSMNAFLEEVDTLLPEEYSKLIDMSKWSKDVRILNDLVDWMGFKACKFKEVGHENWNGFGRDKSLEKNTNGDGKGNAFSSRKCRYPHVLEG